MKIKSANKGENGVTWLFAGKVFLVRVPVGHVLGQGRRGGDRHVALPALVLVDVLPHVVAKQALLVKMISIEDSKARL